MFEPLMVVDTIRTLEQLEHYTGTCDVIGFDDTFSEAQDTDGQPKRTVFMKRVDATVTVFDLQLEDDGRQNHVFQGFEDEGRFALLEVRHANLAQRHETVERELWIIDRWTASLARFPIYFLNFQWEFEENNDRQVDHKSEVTAHYDFDGTTLTCTNTCTMNGMVVACDDPGGMFTLSGAVLLRTHTYDPVSKEMILLPISARAATAAVDSMSTATSTIAPEGFFADHFDPGKFLYTSADSLFPGRCASDHLVSLTSEDRAAYLQRYADRFTGSDLHFFSILRCCGAGRQITILCTNNDARDLLWLSYDRENHVNGIDTLLSSYGDGQFATQEYAYWEHGVLWITQVTEETLRDGNDTMAYLIDTLTYESRVEWASEIFPVNGSEPLPQYDLRRTQQDLTNHWIIQYPTGSPAQEQRRSIRALIPEGKHVFTTAIGDLNNDGWNDHVFVLEPDSADHSADRDLQIVFTSPSAEGFQEKLFLPGFIPGRSAGGFHDPIGEEGYSGIAISGDSLVITLFGGSAWKWQSRSVYRYWEEADDFFLMQEQGRNYHSPAVFNMEQELPEYEARLAAGEVLSTEEEEHYKELKKTEESYRWTPVLYPLGERPMRRR